MNYWLECTWWQYSWFFSRWWKQESQCQIYFQSYELRFCLGRLVQLFRWGRRRAAPLVESPRKKRWSWLVLFWHKPASGCWWNRWRWVYAVGRWDVPCTEDSSQPQRITNTECSIAIYCIRDEQSYWVSSNLPIILPQPLISPLLYRDQISRKTKQDGGRGKGIYLWSL